MARGGRRSNVVIVTKCSKDAVAAGRCWLFSWRKGIVHRSAMIRREFRYRILTVYYLISFHSLLNIKTKMKKKAQLSKLSISKSVIANLSSLDADRLKGGSWVTAEQNCWSRDWDSGCLCETIGGSAGTLVPNGSLQYTCKNC